MFLVSWSKVDMEFIRYKYIIAMITLLQSNVRSDNITTNKTSVEHSTNCPFTKLIEDVFKIHNKSLNRSNIKDSAKVKWLVNTISNITNADENTNSHIQEEIVNSIIASINKIKENMSSDENSNDGKLNEAIILNIPKNISEIEANKQTTSEKDISLDTSKIKIGQIKSGIEEKLDIRPNENTENLVPNKTILLNETNLKHAIQSTEEPKEYVEILTIEPNNTNTNTSSTRNILDILKNLIPIFNSSITKDFHNITVIERDDNNSNSIKVNKNITTIVVTFCDKDTSNITKTDVTKEIDKDTVLKSPSKETENDDDDYYDDDNDEDYLYFGDDVPATLTVGEQKDVLEAAEYGMQKMHELYSVMEPKLYSMGLWLDATNPARYVAAFNAPSEDAHKYSRYGYASLQAATRLKELVSGNEDALEGRTEEIQFPKASALRQSSLLQQCPLRGTPKCPPASKRYRTHDGTCNNLNRPRWGSTMTPVQRFIAPSYSDDLQAPRRSVFGTKLPSAREISSLIHESRNVENHGVTHLLMQWGQFVDHDVTSTSQSRGFNGSVPRCCKDGGRDFVPKEFMHPECFPIAVPPSDPFYGPRGVRCLDFVRSSPAPRGDCALGWREQLNQVSAYIDGSPLYGSSARKSDNLRLFRNGMLQYGRVQQQRPLLPPERRDELCRGGAVSTDCFRSGDARVNEQPGLVAAHIVWLRQHNRMAQELAHLNPHWSDEKIYQETRKIVGAMIQHITYKEFLPIVLGADVMELFELKPLKKGFFKDYNPKINPSPASSFGSAAFRFGHSLVQPSMMRYDRFHRPLQNNVSLHDELTNPSNIWSIGAVDRLLLGMVNQPIQKRDEFITEELTNHLFQTPEFDFGMDLAAINIQRGRDHGMPPYTAWREPCGLSAISEFEDLYRVMPARVVRKIQALYKHVDDIDLFTGGMAERPVVGGLVGPTFACIIAQQFSNLRKGDRFWYENGDFDSSFTPAQLQQIRRISFAQVLCRTLDSIDSIQPFVFLSPDHPDNNRILCHDGLLNDFDLSPWIEINSDFDNDIRKSDDEFLFTADKTDNLTNDKTKPRTTTVKPKITTNKTDRLSLPSNNRDDDKKSPESFTTSSVITPILTQKPTTTTAPNRTNNIHNTTTDVTTDKTLTKLNITTQRIDDKLDFKNKSLRYDSVDRLDSRNKYNYRPTQPYTEYDEDEIQSVQSVVINNLNHKRPYHYNRPVISVTEKLDKFTYLINYVPKPTQSWRQTTRRPHDRDVVKVTYQTYDDTYRRPTNGYYYNRRDDETDVDKDVFEPNYRFNRPNTFVTNEDYLQSARSNNKLLTTATPRVTEIDKTTTSTTDNWHKLITFGYVGTYKGHETTTKTETDVTTEDKRVKSDALSKDFSTDELKNNNEYNEKPDPIKLSTFFLYDTTTKPYLERPIRRHDDRPMTNDFRPHKYYYIRNVLHKYNDATDEFNRKDNLKEHSSSTAEEAKVEDRSAGGMVDLDQIGPNKSNKLRVKKKPGPAKTPSVSFQVIPSENSPSNWAVYEENEELGESLHQMPSVINDPHSLKELPRPLKLTPLKRRRPGRS